MKSLSQILDARVKQIDALMADCLDLKDRPYANLISSMQYSAHAGGKRVRPFLTLEWCRLLGGEETAALPYAAAIEMIHTYSLIHDDLPCMDNDDERRGKPTNHKVYGEATALLAGDALLTHAFALAAGNEAIENNSPAVSLLAANAGVDGMIGGQALDLAFETRRPDKDEHLTMNLLKTGCLIRCACLLGCLAAGHEKGSPAFLAADAYGKNIGLAFQIRDDLLDAGTEDQKTTFLSFMTKEEAEAQVIALTDAAIKVIAPFDNNKTLSDFAAYLAKRIQ